MIRRLFHWQQAAFEKVVRTLTLYGATNEHCSDYTPGLGCSRVEADQNDGFSDSGWSKQHRRSGMSDRVCRIDLAGGSG